jgi:hypothetical protein
VRLRRWIFAPLPFAIVGSACSHGSVVVAMLFGAAGHTRGASEGGHAGAGDTSIDVSLAGDPEPTAAPSTPPAQDKAEEKSEDAVEPPRPKQPAVVPREKPSTPRGTADSANGGRLPGPVRVGLPNAGDGETVEGQRALLPSAMRCNDPVQGKWEALKYDARRGTWVHFTLTVRRDASGVTSGTILSRTWAGTMFDREPPPCTFGGFDVTVSMAASGRADATGRITFGSSHYTVVSTRCLTLDTSYAPDNFSGTIDPARQEFQSLNNDGANDINAPYVFRRTGC